MSLLLSTQLLHFNPDNFESLFLILGSKERLDLVCKTLILSYSCKDFPDAFCRRSLSALFFPLFATVFCGVEEVQYYCGE